MSTALNLHSENPAFQNQLREGQRCNLLRLLASHVHRCISLRKENWCRKIVLPQLFCFAASLMFHLTFVSYCGSHTCAPRTPQKAAFAMNLRCRSHGPTWVLKHAVFSVCVCVSDVLCLSVRFSLHPGHRRCFCYGHEVFAESFHMVLRFRFLPRALQFTRKNLHATC